MFKKMIHRKALLRCLVFGILGTALFATLGVVITKNNENDTSAASGTINISWSESDIAYYPSHQSDEDYTHYFQAEVSSGSWVSAFCVEPTNMDMPDIGSTNYVSVDDSSAKTKKLKLLFFIYRYYDDIAVARAARNDIFEISNDYSDARAIYGWIHVLAGYLNNDVEAGNVGWAWLGRADTKLNSYINGSDVWTLAQNLTLYRTDNGGKQELMWLGAYDFPKGNIEITKCDSATQICGNDGGSSFDGIEFSIYNDSGRRIYIPSRGHFNDDYTDKFYNDGDFIAKKTISGGTGKVTFDHLAVGKYLIKETGTNTYYQLSTDQKTGTLTSNGQTIQISFSNEGYGDIIVNKTDSKTGSCTTQGNATFNGTKFTVINKTGHSISYGGATYANNAEVATKTLTGGSCSAKFEKLPYGTYNVKETAVGAGYNENDEVKTVTIPTNNNTTMTVSYANEVKRGKVTVNKTDTETGRCDVRARAHSFAGTTFQIINKSNNAVYIGNTSYAKNAVITSLTKTFGENDCSITIEGLPYGDYWIKETAAAPGYVKLEDPIEITIPTNNSYSLTESAGNTQIRGDLRFRKVDESNQNPMPNTLFSISAIDEDFNILETHFVVSDQNGVVDTSNSFARHSFHTNGYDEMYNDGETAYTTIPFLGYGTWFGLDTEGNSLPVNDNLGALPQGKYLIQEMRCDANIFCYELKDQKKVVTISQANQTVDLGDWNNECVVFELGTEAVDGDDGDHYVEADKDVKIVDHIHYCARKGLTFTIKGILMNRATGEPLLINGETVENSIEVTPENECDPGDDAEMEFVFDGTGYGGEEIVVFESLYYKNEEVISHEDLDDDFQTVEMVYIHTTAVNEEDGSKVLPLNEDVVIEDTVDYCLIPGKTYIIRGLLMDRDENTPFLVDGEEVQSEVTVTPEEKCGQAIIHFHINTTGLGGKRLVVFESLYLEEEPEKPIVKHEDLYNYDESIEVEPETPDTGFGTRIDKSGESSNGVFVVMGGALVLMGLGGYSYMRHSSKKKVMKF